MSADADPVCGAGYGERSPRRVAAATATASVTGHAGRSIELAVPKLREGSYFPDWLLQPRRWDEQAFVSVIADAYLAGVSTRRVEKLVQQLGVERMGKSQVSRLARAPTRSSMTSAPARSPRRCHRRGRRRLARLHAWPRGARGQRREARELGRAPGLVDAIAATLPGAGWQRCRTHFMRNLLTRVPKSAQSFVATMVRTIFAQPDAATVHEQHRPIVDQPETRFPEAAALLEEAAAHLLAFTAFPKEHRRQLWSNNSLERLNKEIRRRTDVVGIFRDRAAIVRLVGAVLAEQTDEWAVAAAT